MCKPYWQRLEGMCSFRWHRICPDTISTLTIQKFSCLQICLGGSDSIPMPQARTACRLVPQYRRQNTSIGFQAYHMKWAPHRSIPARRIRQQAILLKTVSGIGVRGFKGHKHAKADIIHHLAPIRFLTGSNIHQTSFCQPSACLDRFKYGCQIMQTCG